MDESKFVNRADLLLKESTNSEQGNARIRRATKVLEEENRLKGKIQADFKAFRSYVVLTWICTNVLFVTIVERYTSTTDQADWYVSAIIMLVLSFGIFKSLGAILYWLKDEFETHECHARIQGCCFSEHP